MAYLGFTVIYTTMGNRGNMSRQLIYVVTQLLSDSVMTFFFLGGGCSNTQQTIICMQHNTASFDYSSSL